MAGDYYNPNQGACPGCGRCNTCGRGNYVGPYYPTPFMPYTYPTWIVTSGASPVGNVITSWNGNGS